MRQKNIEFNTIYSRPGDPYQVIVRPYLLGQYRIQLCDRRLGGGNSEEGSGGIVREMCTYKATTMTKTVSDIMQSDDPLAYCCSLERPSNCELPGRGRIRLDQ